MTRPIDAADGARRATGHACGGESPGGGGTGSAAGGGGRAGGRLTVVMPMREASSEASVDLPQPDVPPNRIATDSPRSCAARHARTQHETDVPPRGATRRDTLRTARCRSWLQADGAACAGRGSTLALQRMQTEGSAAACSSKKANAGNGNRSRTGTPFPLRPHSHLGRAEIDWFCAVLRTVRQAAHGVRASERWQPLSLTCSCVAMSKWRRRDGFDSLHITCVRGNRSRCKTAPVLGMTGNKDTGNYTV
jgi:hypothetical protein